MAKGLKKNTGLVFIAIITYRWCRLLLLTFRFLVIIRSRYFVLHESLDIDSIYTCYNECDATGNIIFAIGKQESIQLSISRHSDELKEIFEAIPNNDTEVLNRSREVLFQHTQFKCNSTLCNHCPDFSIYRYNTVPCYICYTVEKYVVCSIVNCFALG